MSRFAEGTSVPVQRTRAEIEALLEKHGAKRRATAQDDDRGIAVVQFDLQYRRVRFELQLPRLQDFATRQVRGRQVDVPPEQQRSALEQARRERWRALLLALKAKFVSLEGGIETFEEAFLAHLVVPGVGRFGKYALPAIAQAYKGGSLPPLLSSGEGPADGR